MNLAGFEIQVIAGAEDGERHADVCTLTEPRRAPPRVHRLVATESDGVALRFEKRNAVGSKPSREAEARKLHPLLEKLGIARAGLHAFPHFSASVIDRLNVPLKLRQQRLGHSDAAMTLGVYSHVAQEDDVRFAAQLGGILDPSGPFEKGKGPAPVTQALVN
jgi:hypothetical protein